MKKRELRTDSDRERRKELLRVRFERDALAAVLDYFPIGIVILDHNNELLQMNQVARKLLEDKPGSSSRLTGEPPSLRRLTGIISDLLGDEDTEQPVRFHKLAGRRRSMRQAYEMLLVSLNECEHAEVPTVVFLCDPYQEDIADPLILQATHDLTRTEAVVASKLVDGYSLEKIAEDLGVELSTARSHLKRIFAKTDTHRQSDLVRVLMQGLSRLSMKDLAPVRTKSR